MICAASEIGMEDKTDGILDLSSIKPEVGAPLAQALGKDDVILVIDNNPNAPPRFMGALRHRPRSRRNPQ